MSVLEVTKEENVYIVTMNDPMTGNGLTPEVIQEHFVILDEIEASSENVAVVLSSSDPKSWCTGINLEKVSRDQLPSFKPLMDRLMLRWALVNAPTIGCLTGHAFAGGAILASALDFRIMREDRGWFCFPEVDIQIPFSSAMHLVLESISNPQSMNQLLYTGRRIGGAEALKMGVVDQAYPGETLQEKTLEFAKFMAQKDRNNYFTIKKNIKRDIAECFANYS